MGKQVRHSIFGRHLIYKKKGGRGKHGRAQVFHLVRSPHHHHLGEGRDAVALQQPNILVGENRSSNDASSQCEARGLWHISDDHHQLHLSFLCRGVPTPVWAGPAPPPTLPPPAPTPPPTPPTTPPTPLAEALLLILPTDPTFRHSLLLQLLPQ